MKLIRPGPNPLILPGEIVLFNEGKLKNFLYFLNWMGAKRPLRFHYQGEDTQLEKDQNKIMNVLFKCDDQLPWEKKEEATQRKLFENPNPAFMEFLRMAHEWEGQGHELTISQRKLISLFNGLLRTSDYFILENPETSLLAADLHLFKNALSCHIRNTKATVLLHTANNELWSDLVEKKVERTKTKSFAVQSLVKTQPLLTFNLPSKKAA